MKKNRVPIISFLLSVCLLLSAFTPLARAEEGGAGETPIFSKDYITSFQLVNQDGEDLSEEQEVEKNSEVHLNFAYKVPDEQFDKITAGIQYYITTIHPVLCTRS